MAGKKQGMSKPKTKKVATRGYTSSEEGRSATVGETESGSILINLVRPALDEEKSGKRASTAVRVRRKGDEVVVDFLLMRGTAEALYHALAIYFEK